MTRRSLSARTTEALRSLDPAPPTALTDAEIRHAAAERARIIATPVVDPARTRTPRPYRRLVAVAGTVAALAVLVPFALGGTLAFASWTAVPSPLAGIAAEEAATACLRKLEPDPTGTETTPLPDMDLVIAEQRGDWVTIILSGSGAEASCLMPADTEPADDRIFASLDLDAPEPPMPDRDGLTETFSIGGAVDVPNRIGLGTVTDWYGWVSGYVGEDVIGVTVHSPAGTDSEASLSGGRYSAWWPAGLARGDNPGVGGGWSYTVTLTDGTTHEIEAQR